MIWRWFSLTFMHGFFFMLFVLLEKLVRCFRQDAWSDGKGKEMDGKGLTGDVGKEGFIYPELMGQTGALFFKPHCKTSFL